MPRRRHKHRNHSVPRIRSQLFRWWHLAVALAVSAFGVAAGILLLGSR